MSKERRVCPASRKLTWGRQLLLSGDFTRDPWRRQTQTKGPHREYLPPGPRICPSRPRPYTGVASSATSLLEHQATKALKSVLLVVVIGVYQVKAGISWLLVTLAATISGSWMGPSLMIGLVPKST